MSEKCQKQTWRGFYAIGARDADAQPGRVAAYEGYEQATEMEEASN
jgi:hypothetical protein